MKGCSIKEQKGGTVQDDEAYIGEVILYGQEQSWNELWKWSTVDEFFLAYGGRYFLCFGFLNGDPTQIREVLFQNLGSCEAESPIMTLSRIEGSGTFLVRRMSREKYERNHRQLPTLILECRRQEEVEDILELRNIILWFPIIQKRFDDVGNLISIVPTPNFLILSATFPIKNPIHPENIVRFRHGVFP